MLEKNGIVHSLSFSQAMSSSQTFFDQEKNKVIEIGRQRNTCSCFSQDKRNAALLCRRQFPAVNLS